MSISAKRIGLFDSGVGGLSILRSLADRQPNLRFVYLGDTGRCPYGNRSQLEISLFVEEIVTWFNSAGVDQIVMACNTSAAVAAGLARQLSRIPVYDLISSTARFVAPRFKRVAVIATNTTCKSNAFLRSIKELAPDCEVLELPCPDLVPLVERGVLSGPEVDQTIAKYVNELKKFDLDSLVFGCTHFPFLDSAFRMALPESVVFIDPANPLRDELLKDEKPNSNSPTTRVCNYDRHTYFCTGDTEKFAQAAEICLGLESGKLKNGVCHLLPQELQLSLVDTSSPLVRTQVLKSPFYEKPSPTK